MRVTERLAGSHLWQDAIVGLQPGERVTVMRRLYKPGQWFVVDDQSEKIGYLTAASPAAKVLNAGGRLVHASVVDVSSSARAQLRRIVQVSFQLADRL